MTCMQMPTWFEQTRLQFNLLEWILKNWFEMAPNKTRKKIKKPYLTCRAWRWNIWYDDQSLPESQIVTQGFVYLFSNKIYYGEIYKGDLSQNFICILSQNIINMSNFSLPDPRPNKLKAYLSPMWLKPSNGFFTTTFPPQPSIRNASLCIRRPSPTSLNSTPHWLLSN